MKTEEIWRTLDGCIPGQLRQDLIRMLFASYFRADELYQGLGQPERSDSLAVTRRAFIERGLRDVANKHAGVMAWCRKNKGRTANHVVLKSQNLILTESSVRGPNQMVRRSEFRRSYAGSKQMDLFPELALQDPDGLYTILLHGPNMKDGKYPGFAILAVPDAELSVYRVVHDLFAQFPALIASLHGEDSWAGEALDLKPKKRESEGDLG